MTRPFTYGSVCSGIEAASVAWHPLGWRAAFLSEIEAFPRSVLAHRFPATPLHGDFTTIQTGDYDAIDLLVGGTPCQSFSLAGLRLGLADARGNLALEYLRLASRLQPTWLLWENVVGVLSSNRGRDFGAFLGGLAQLGYGFAYRVLDAQHFGVPQRRRRVFVVGHLGDWRRAAAVLFERESLRGRPAPRRDAREGIAPTLTCGSTSGGRRPGMSADDSGLLVAKCLTAHPGERYDLETENFVTHTLPASHGASEDGTGRGTPLMPHAFQWQASAAMGMSVSHKICPTLDKSRVPAVHTHAVRRITPREAERLQGFQDDWTMVPHRGKPAADAPRYKALGNSMAVPCMAWIGRRIAAQAADIAAPPRPSA